MHALYFTACNHSGKIVCFRLLLLLENVFALISSQQECRKLFAYIQKVVLTWVKNMADDMSCFHPFLFMKKKEKEREEKSYGLPGIELGP